MTVGAPLIIGPAEREALAELRSRAAASPADVLEVMETVKTAVGLEQHRKRMAKLTELIPGPWPFYVTYSIETGHPIGPCRHMSMSIARKGRSPNEHAVWMVAELLGFTGDLGHCAVWLEDIGGGDKAVNCVQPLSMGAR